MALTRQQISQIYRDELKRSPNFDVEGGASYWLNSDITDPEVLRKTIRQSGEYKDLQSKSSQSTQPPSPVVSGPVPGITLPTETVQLPFDSGTGGGSDKPSKDYINWYNNVATSSAGFNTPQSLREYGQFKASSSTAGGTGNQTGDSAIRDKIIQQYEITLQRTPSQSEIDYWVNSVNQVGEANALAAFQAEAQREIAGREKTAGTMGVVQSAEGKVPTGATFKPVTQQFQQNELVATDIDQQDVSLTAAQASTENLEIPVPQKTAAQQYQAYAIEGTPEAVAAQGKLSKESIVGDIQGTVSKQAIAEAAQGEVSEEATVQYQLSELYDSFEEGKPPPAWAAPAVRNVGAIMAQRGLGASSMAAAAITQAIMEAGIPIAQADAQTYATMDLANLNNRQQAALQNAATFAAMDRANLDARMQAAVTNAQSFLALDMANLNNEQRSMELNHQAEVQTMFTNAAAENAARQFNAQNQQQVDLFYAELEVQVGNANANRLAAQEQFNVNERNAMEQFQASVNDARERFETQMRVQIDQSNAQWRRSVNTANTAVQNEANRVNAQNILNVSQTAQNNIWQKYRDEAAWAFQSSENKKQREHQIGMLAIEFAQRSELYEKQLEDQVAGELGKLGLNILFGEDD